MKLLHTPKGTIVELEVTAFDGGGEAKVYKVKSPVYSTPLCAKIYTGTDPSALHLKQLKIEYMIDHNPYQNAPVAVNESAAWPVEILLDQHNVFAGFLMPLIENSVSAVNILNRSLSQEFFQFDITDAKSYNNYLKIAYSIAKAVVQLHSYGDYVMVDFKLDNIRLKRKGEIALVDMDSIQITEKDKVLFHSPVATDDYRPPEGFIKNIVTASNTIDPSWDFHSMAVAFFYLFLQIHPFGAIHKTDGDLTNIAALVKAGYYAMGKRKNELNLPIVMENFDLLGKQIQKLFHQCFENGYKSPDKRPDAAAWRDALLQEIQRTAGKDISLGKHHAPASPKKTPQTSNSVVGSIPAATSPQQPNTPPGPATQPTVPPAQPVYPAPNTVPSPTPAPSPTPSPNPVPASAAIPSLYIHRFIITKHVNYATLEWQVFNAATVKLNGITVLSADSLMVTILPKLFTLEVTDLKGVVTYRSIALLAPAMPTLNPVMPIASPVALSRPIKLNRVLFAIKPNIKLIAPASFVWNPIPLKVHAVLKTKSVKLSKPIPLNQKRVALNNPLQLNTKNIAGKTKSGNPLNRLAPIAAVFFGILISFLKF